MQNSIKVIFLFRCNRSKEYLRVFPNGGSCIKRPAKKNCGKKCWGQTVRLSKDGGEEAEKA